MASKNISKCATLATKLSDQVFTRHSFQGMCVTGHVKDMPGPRPVLPLVGTGHIYWPFREFYKCDYAITRPGKMFKKYGPIYRENLSGTWIVHLHNNDDIKLVSCQQGNLPMRVQNEAFVKHRSSRPDLYETLGASDLNGPEWLSFRKKLVPGLSKAPSNDIIKGISNIGDDLASYIMQYMNEQKTNQINVFDAFRRYATESIWLRVYGEKVYCKGKRLQPRVDQASCNALRLFDSLPPLISSSLWKYISTPAYRRFTEVERTLYEITRETCRARSATPGFPGNAIERDCMLNQFLEMGQFSEKEMTVGIMDTITSGTVLIATLASMTLQRLAQEPLAILKLQKEVDAILKSPSDIITQEKLNQMYYMKAVIKEGTRIVSPVPFTVKLLPEPVVIDGYKIEKMTPIFCHVRAPSLNDKNFQWPTKLIPERWIRPDDPLSGPEFANLYHQSRANSFLVLPFGFGMRNCPGITFTKTNMEILLAKLIRNFTMRSSGDVLVGNKFIIEPIEDVNVEFETRM